MSAIAIVAPAPLAVGFKTAFVKEPLEFGAGEPLPNVEHHGFGRAKGDGGINRASWCIVQF